LSHKSGWIRVIAGHYENLASKIPEYSKQFLYHIHLEAGMQFSFPTEKGLDYAAFLPLQNAVINDTDFSKGEFIAFDENEGAIKIQNHSGSGIDIIVFGGEKYAEPIVAEGPFVMNTRAEITDAYRDFHAGKYGEIYHQRPVRSQQQYFAFFEQSVLDMSADIEAGVFFYQYIEMIGVYE
jgi:redox-sensitive bicupin YhaK (pirin superfamily)